MNKKYLVLIAVVLLCVILATFVACNYEKKYAEKLQDLGYTVTVRRSKEYNPGYKGGYYNITARKYGYMVYIKIYDYVDDAESAYNSLVSEKENNKELELIYREGKAVIYGHEEAVNDARS